MTEPGRAPRLSVVIPCYNAEAYIGATLDSVLAQGESSMEIIVVDDGSRDGSVALLRARYPQVRLIEQANAGVAAARNCGIAAARGEWIAFVDADDIWLPGKLAAQFALLAANPDCRMCYTAWQVWPSVTALPEQPVLDAVARSAADRARWHSASGWIYPQLLLDCVMWTSTTMAQRSLFDDIGVFDRSLPIGEDYDLWLRASQRTRILHVAHPYALYRVHPASITKSAPTDNFRAIVVDRALRQWGLRSPDGACAERRDVRYALAKSWTDLASDHIRARHFGQAWRAGCTALRMSATYVPAWKVLVKSSAGALASTIFKEQA